MEPIFALTACSLGRGDGAGDLLEHAAEKRERAVRLDGNWNDLREDARYRALEARFGVDAEDS